MEKTLKYIIFIFTLNIAIENKAEKIMSDNIFTTQEILEMDSTLNITQNPELFITEIYSRHPNSYYIQALNLWYNDQTSNVDEIVLSQSNNTYALLYLALICDENEKARFYEFINKSIEFDAEKINRWSLIEKYNFIYEEGSGYAQQIYNDIVELYPDFLDIYIHKALNISYEARKGDSNIDLAINLLLEYKVKYKSDQTSLLSTIGDLYYQNDEFDSAVYYFDIALSSFEENIDALLGLAKVNIKQSNFSSCIDWCSRALEIDTCNWIAAMNIGSCYFYLEDNSNGEKYYKMAIEFCKDDTEQKIVFEHYLTVLLQMQKLTKAKEILDYYANNFEDYFNLTVFQVVFLTYSHHEKLAISTVDNYIAIYPEDRESLIRELGDFNVIIEK